MMWCRGGRGTRNCVCMVIGFINAAYCSKHSHSFKVIHDMYRAIALLAAQSAVTRKTDKYGDIGPRYFTSHQHSRFLFHHSTSSALNQNLIRTESVNFIVGSIGTPEYYHFGFTVNFDILSICTRLIYGAIYVDAPVDTAGIRDPIPFQSEDLLFL